MTRQDRIKALARANALEGLDQGRVADYEDNLRDTLAGIFPDWTPDEAALALETFNQIVGAQS